jgi:hypothetical protein
MGSKMSTGIGRHFTHGLLSRIFVASCSKHVGLATHSPGYLEAFELRFGIGDGYEFAAVIYIDILIHPDTPLRGEQAN